jgi:hypothetical protein
MDHEVEASAERVRHHLRRPLAGSRNLLMNTAGDTVPVTDPDPAVAAAPPASPSVQDWGRCCRSCVVVRAASGNLLGAGA